jgi:lipopolysaccharide biosynthesis protein
MSSAFRRNGTPTQSRKDWSALADPLDSQDECLAVVVHAFYIDVFRDIMGYLNALPGPLRLYVTAPSEVQESVETCLQSSRHPSTVMVCANRGRDVLPFLKIIPTVIENGHRYFLKVHTKKSPHRWYGDFWRRDMYANLMSPPAVETARSILRDDPRVGIIAPKNHLVPMTLYSTANERRIFELSEQLGVSKERALGLRFPAGTMFFGRTESVLPLLSLAL